MWPKAQEKKTFFLYNIGRSPDVLCLGNIMVGSYGDPDQLAKYVHGTLSSSDRQKHASSTDLGACAISKTAGIKVGPSIDVMSMVTMGFSVGRDRERAVSSDEGKRVILEDPRAFLDDVILGNPANRDKITLLLSAASRHRWGLINFGNIKVWMLTGYYLLKDAQVTRGRSSEAGATAKVDGTTAAAAGGVPVGGGLELNISRGTTTSVQSKGWLVWAAQWRLLDVHDTWPGAQHVGSNAMLTLRMDVVSRGIMYAAKPEQQYASLSLKQEEFEGNVGPEAKLELPSPGWWDWMSGNVRQEDPNDVVAADVIDVDIDIDDDDQRCAGEIDRELKGWREFTSDSAPHDDRRSWFRRRIFD